MASLVDAYVNAKAKSSISDRICSVAMFHLGTNYSLGSKDAFPLNGAHGTPRKGTGTDCSGFVIAVLKDATADPRLDASKMGVAAIRTSDVFETVTTEQPGDLVCWDGHVGIVMNADLKKFVGAQSSTGVMPASYADGYWSAQPGRMFRRYKPNS